MNHKISVSEVFESAWKSFTGNAQFVYYLLVPAFTLSLLGIILFPSSLALQNESPQAFVSMIPSLVLSLLSGIASILATISILFFLRSGKKDSWKSWSSYARLLPKYIGVCILQGLMIMVGLILFIVPGIYLALRYAFVSYRTLEHPTESIKNLFSAEAKATEGSRFTILLIGLSMGCIALIAGGLLGTLATLIVGVTGSAFADFLVELLLTPFFTLVSILTYIKLTEKKVAGTEAVSVVPEPVLPPLVSEEKEVIEEKEAVLPEEKEVSEEEEDKPKEPSKEPIPVPAAEPVS